MSPSLASFVLRLLALAGLLVAVAAPIAHAQAPAPAGATSALPSLSAHAGGQVTQIVISGGTRSLFKIAVPPLQGEPTAAGVVVDTASRDFALSSLFQVLDPKSFVANLGAEGLGIDAHSWRSVGAEGVIKGSASGRGDKVKLELRFYVVARGSEPQLKRDYEVASGDARSAAHQFCNEVVKWFTGTPASFGSRLVFSATTGRGQKGIFAIESDGHGVARLPAVSNVALAPALGPAGVYYAAGLADGSYKLFQVGAAAPVLSTPGLVFGVAFGAGKMALVLSQNGQSDIHVGAADGSGLAKVTGGGLNTHPAIGPGGRLAYVSNQGGSPQIYVDGKRVTWRGSYNMAPAWCNEPEGLRVLFMGRDGSSWDIFSVDPSGGGIKRLTQDQGSNTYPACSPDGRMVAFFSTRGGLYVSNPQGLNQQKLANVQGESLRWEGN